MRESIEEMLVKEPFSPFRIILTGGPGYDILNPHLVAMGQTQLTVYFPRSDRWAILRINQVASVEVLEAAT
jgi:hypothetical protein